VEGILTAHRKKYGEADQIALATQVNGRCPLCGKKLFYVKRGRQQKAYELAHIYPLNPSPEEIEELQNEEKIHSDVNHPDNLIALCGSCHEKFDKPRTANEYRDLVKQKKAFIRRSEQEDIQSNYPIDDDIRKIIEVLYNTLPEDRSIDLTYDPKSISKKLRDDFPLPTKQKIKSNVSSYYQIIRSKFLEVEGETPNTSELICAQVRAYYLQQLKAGSSQQEIFENIVDWINSKTKPRTIEAAEIVTSYFIQNCEVFE
jgi:hypothetical protein